MAHAFKAHVMLLY